MSMMKTCPACGKIVPLDHDCPARKANARRWDRAYRENKGYKKFIASSDWQGVREQIVLRDQGLDQAALHGLDPDHPEPYIVSSGLQVHHITKWIDDQSLARDPYNLITLSERTHTAADDGRIDAEALRAIARDNQNRYDKE